MIVVKLQNGEAKRKINQKIPYGGTVESHIIANLLILEKMKKIIETINKVEGYKVIGYTGYADDIAIFIKVYDEEKNEQWLKIKDDDDLKIEKFEEEFCNGFNLFKELKINRKKKIKIFHFQNYMDDNKMKLQNFWNKR